MPFMVRRQQYSVTAYTRREFSGLVAAGLAGVPFVGLGAAPQAASSRFAGVRVGTQSYSFRDRNLNAAIAAMSTLGLSYCELWSGHVEARDAIVVPQGGNRREAVRAWRLETPIEYFHDIRRRFEAAGVTLTSYDLPFNASFTDEEITRVFEIGRALGVGVITSSAQVSVAERLEPFAAKAGMRVGFHNHSRIAPNEFATPDDFATALEDRPHMAITLDIGHFTAANFDALAYLDEHHDRIVSLHIKDRKRDQGATLPFGEGDAQVADVLRRLRDRKWDIPAHIEYEYRGQDTVEEMRKLLAYCRTVLESGPGGPAQFNTLTAAERAEGWRLLFDGATIDQWRGFRRQTLPPGWEAVDGALTRVRRAGDIISIEQFADFDFRFEWQIVEGGNSGIMYYVTEAGAETYHTGPEYQILDNARHPDGKSALTSSGACYALYAPPRDVTRPVGEWNQGRIVINQGRGEHWLNGERTAMFDLNSDEWRAKVLASKFKEWPEFGLARKGHLAIQEHGSRVAYRNLKIRTP
jgi:sugar phosphate isomerase/epimerase